MSKNKGKETELIDIGKKLGKSQSKDALVKLLLQASTLLAELDQSPPQSTLNAMKGCSSALVSAALLRHKDKEVGLLVAICISEIMRIVAPDAPYSDDTLKEIFQLIVTNFKGLDDVNSPSFARRVHILETVAKVRSCVVMLDLECDDLILEMFETFFDTARDEQPHNVFVAMRNVLTLVLEESEKIPPAIVEVILKNLLKQKKEGSGARKLATAVVEKCADKLEPYVRSFLTSVMVEGKSLDSGLHKDHHEIIFELYCCAPQLLSGVIPHINDELVKDKLSVRLKAVALLGRLFGLPGRQFAQEYPLVFAEFMKRFSDKMADVRVAVVNCAKAFTEANPSGEQASEILGALHDRLLDYDERVRVAVVKAIYDVAKTDPKSVPTDLLRKSAERLRDKKVVVRKAALLKLVELYRSYCTKCAEGSIAFDKEYEWIPGKIARCCNDKETNGLEIILTEQLFPTAISVEEQSKHWALAFSTFDENEKKALQFILLQKQRLQQEMQVYLTARQKAEVEVTPEVEKKLQSIFKVIANCFLDPPKAEENLQKVHQMKDEGVFSALSTLLSPSTSFAEATAVREEMLKKIGEEHAQHEFMKSLATKCGYFFFSREHVAAITKEVIVCKDSGNNRDLVEPNLQLLFEIAIYCPELMADAEEDLLTLLKDSVDSIKEGVVHIMSKSGASFRKGSGSEGRSNVILILEQLCVEGNRKQAKYAISAIAAMTADSGLKALSVLYGRLVDRLEDNTHLPTVLQSLGCIAQNAMPIFETREDDIIKFVVRNVLRRPSPQEVPEFVSESDSPSDHVLLKIYALKALVKSFLPKMNAHQRTRLPGLLKVLVKILACGEISDDMNTSDADKAHLRLAAAEGVLRLARRWDSQIPIDVFHMVVLTVQDNAAHVRRALLRKIHHYLRDRTLNLKYASAYALCSVDTVQEIAVEARRFMSDFVDDYRKEAHKTLIGQAEKTSITVLPEYALVYLVHVLAHHPNYPVASGGVQPDASAYEPFYRDLLFFLRALVHQEAESKNEPGKKEDGDNLPLILAILRTIKGCENVVDRNMTEILYAICDIAILITKDIAQQKKKLVETYPGVIPLPASLYKVLDPKAPEAKAAVAKAADKSAADGGAPAANSAEVKAAEVPSSAEVVEANASRPAEANASKEGDAGESNAGEGNDSKRAEAEAKTGDGDAKTGEAGDSMMSEANDIKTRQAEDLTMGGAEDTKMAEGEDTKMAKGEDTKMAKGEDTKMAEGEDTKMAEGEDTKMAEGEDTKMAEGEDTKVAEGEDTKVAEGEDTKVAEGEDTKMAKGDETKMAEAEDIKMSGTDESKKTAAVEFLSSEATEVKAAGSNEIKAAEPKEPEAHEGMALEQNGNEAVIAEKPTVAEPDEPIAPEAVDSASKAPESGEPAVPVEGDGKSAAADVKKAVEEPSKVDGSHLPPCFTDKDVLARFKNVIAKSGQPASPRGRKRAKRVDNGDTISENTEAELEHSEPTPKKGKVENEKRGKGGAGSGTGVIIKGPARGGRKSVDKNESGKKGGKKVELEKEGEEELDDNTPKRKRGRPKGTGKKDEGVSGDEMAGPSSESTPTTSARKGKPASSEARSLTESGKKRGRPAKAKEEDVQEKSAQKDKVATPDKSGKKASAMEKGTSPAWKSEGERGGDESLVGCGIKVWWPLDKKFYKGEVVEYDSKKKKHKILYNDGEQEVLNLAKERWELTGKQAKTLSAKKEKTPTATPPATLSGTKYPEPKKLKVTAKTPTESAKTPDRKEGASEKKSGKSASGGKAAKDAEKSPKASKSNAVAKEQAASAFEFDEVDVEPAAKKQRSTPAVKGSVGKQSKGEKATSASKDSASESAKETGEEKAEEVKGAESGGDDEALVAGQLENKEREEVKSSE